MKVSSLRLVKNVFLIRRSSLKLLLVICLVILLGCSNKHSSEIKSQASTNSTEVIGRSYVAPVIKINRSCEKLAVSQTAMNQCAGSELAQVNKKMNLALSKEEKLYGLQEVFAVQHAWRKYETNECSLQDGTINGNRGGSIEPLILMDCEISLTVNQIYEIEYDIYAQDH